jgi:hypothetical protein
LAVTYNSTIDIGSNWSVTFVYKDTDGVAINLTGYTAAMQVRTTPDASTALISLTTGSGITITGGTGTIAVAITSAQSSLLTATTQAGTPYVYDLEITSGSGVITRLVQGVLTASANVTR